MVEAITWLVELVELDEASEAELEATDEAAESIFVTALFDGDNELVCDAKLVCGADLVKLEAVTEVE